MFDKSIYQQSIKEEQMLLNRLRESLLRFFFAEITLISSAKKHPSRVAEQINTILLSKTFFFFDQFNKLKK